MNSLFDIIQIPFGYLISFVYSLTHSYTVALILFAIVVKVVLFPLGIKQQKNSQKQASLRPKEERIRKKYAGRTDRVTQQKMQQEIMNLYQEEKFSPFGGCLPMIVQLVVVLCLYTVVRSPLTYVSHLDKANVDNIHTVVTEMKGTRLPAEQPKEGEQAPASSSVAVSTPAGSTAAVQQDSFYAEIEDTQYINNNREAFVKAYNAKFGSGEAEKFIEKLPELKLFGSIDLGVIPKNAGLISVPTLFALISLLSAYFSQIVTRKFTYQPAANGDVNNQSSMKIMNFVMPLFSGYISYDMVPLAVTIYWIAQNLLSPVQQIVLSKMYKIPTFTPEELKAAEKALDKNEPKKRKDDTLPKRRSLVYDDDEEEESVSVESEPKNQVKEKAKPDSSPVEKAPLKDESRDK